MSSRASAQASLCRHWQQVCLPYLSNQHHAPKGSHAAMTSSSTTADQAASNGGDTSTQDQPAARERGLACLREEECYYLTGLVTSALREAEHLTEEVHRKASDRFTDYSGKRGTVPLDVAEAEAKLREAYDCASLALTYLYGASSHLRDQPDPGPEPARL